jgi:ABC-type sugar transport system ATPase subunit
MTMIYVTHDRHEAETAADRIALLSEGRLLALAAPKSLYEDPKTLEIARLLGNEYHLLPVSAEHGILYGESGEALEEAEVRDGRYVIAWRNRQRKNAFLLYEAKSGARLL